MVSSLQEIRESYETQMAENAAAFDKMYDDKVKALQQKLDEARMDNSTTRHEWDELESKVSSLTTTNKELQTVNTALNCRVSELQQKLDDMEAKFKAELARKVSNRNNLLFVAFNIQLEKLTRNDIMLVFRTPR